MPSPKNTTFTMAEARAECARLGITPGHSIVECQERIARAKVNRDMADGDAETAARDAIV